jgi:diacylglycerol kinase (ATP)
VFINMGKTCVILNPGAGSVDDVDPLVARIRRMPNAQVCISANAGEAICATKKALRHGCDMIVAAGGDGTLNEVVNALQESTRRITLGLIPLGTGNDFARTFGIPTDIDDAITVIDARHVRPIDLVRFKSDEVRYFANVSAGGFSGLVGEKLTPEMKKTWGPLAYLRGAAAALPDLRAYRTTVSLDNEESLTLNLYDVVIANGRYVGGGTNIAPEASVDDGLVDVILIREQSPAELAVLAARLTLGNHLSTEGVVFRRAKRITVNSRPRMQFNVDGELVGNDPAEFEVLPRELQFVVPKP